MRRQSSTYRLPREHFEADEQPHLLPVPTERYDTPLWCEPKVARDQHAQVACALYSLPEPYRGKKLRARADRTTVRFYAGAVLVKMHARVSAGRRATDPTDFPPEKTAYAMRDIAFLQRQADGHGASVGRLAAIILDSPLPWTRMRRVYALLSLARKYGDPRVNEAAAMALAYEMYDVRRLQRILEHGIVVPATTPPTSAVGPVKAGDAKVIPIARYLRASSQYALALPVVAPAPATVIALTPADSVSPITPIISLPSTTSVPDDPDRPALA